MPRSKFLFLPLLLASLASPARPLGAGQELKVLLKPRFRAGEGMRYEVALRIRSESTSEGLISGPNPPNVFEGMITTTVRVEALEVSAEKGTRLSLTYEESSVDVKGEANDPDVAKLEVLYAKLKGKAILFTLAADGRVSQLEDPEHAIESQEAMQAMQSWLSQSAFAGQTPNRPVAPGESWENELPMQWSSIPGMIWQARSTYLRNEPCQPGILPPPGEASDQSVPGATGTCAVILTSYTSRQKDPAAQEVKGKGGTRMTSRAEATGEGLSYLALDSGLLFSSTQKGDEHVELTFERPPEIGGNVTFRGHVHTESNVRRLPER